MDKDGNMDEDAQEVVERMDELVSQVSDGTVIEDGCNDVLSMALGKKDHPGHPLASGPGVIKRTYLAPTPQHDLEVADLKLMFNDLLHKFNSLESKIKDGKKNKELKAQEDVPIESVKASCSIFSNLPSGSAKCKLLLDNPKRVVAHGAVIIAKPGEPEFLHNIPLDPTCKKVHVLTIVESMGSEEVPFPNELADVFIVKEAQGNILAWPMDLIELTPVVSLPTKSNSAKHITSNQKLVGNVVETGSQLESLPTKISIFEPSSRLEPLDHDVCTESTSIRKRMAKLKYLNFYAKEEMVVDDVIPVELPEEVVGYQIPIPITSDEIIKWYNQKHVELSHMSVFIKVLFEKTRTMGKDNCFEFVCPHYLSHGNGHDDQDKMRYLSTCFKRGKPESIFLAPYSVSEHWILCVIDPKFQICYWLDPMRGSVRNDVKEIVEKGLKIFHANSGERRTPRRNVRWDVIKCPRQLDGTIDCGYYVMRFMKEIIDHNQRAIPIEYFCGYNGRAYKQDEIDVIREQWASYVQMQLDSDFE